MWPFKLQLSSCLSNSGAIKPSNIKRKKTLDIRWLNENYLLKMFNNTNSIL